MTDRPRLLLIDTSGRAGLVAVAEGPALLGERRLDEARRHARDLAPVTAELLGRQGWKACDLHGVVVSLGPGSYTGLRVGLMSARALAYATGCALVGVETFSAFTRQAGDGVTALDVIGDAQQEKVYVQSFCREGGGWRTVAPLRVADLAEWAAGRDPDAWVFGPGVDIFAGRLGGTKVAGPDGLVLSAGALLAAGLERYRAGGRDDVWALEPIYLRRSSAEEQWDRKRDGGA